jgi:hypothetical protein
VPKKRRRVRSATPYRCRDCRTLRYEGELFFYGRCPACRDKNGSAIRTRTGARALTKARDAGTVERDGKVYQVLVLPPKRRKSRRSRGRGP